MLQTPTDWFQGLCPWRVQGRALALRPFPVALGPETDMRSLNAKDADRLANGPGYHRYVLITELAHKGVIFVVQATFSISCKITPSPASSRRASAGDEGAPVGAVTWD
jgi:hypothetical protein